MDEEAKALLRRLVFLGEEQNRLLEKIAQKHGSLGSENEEKVIEYLKEIFPSEFGFDGGKIIRYRK